MSEESTADLFLSMLDPDDSESALKMIEWLRKTGRLHQAGDLRNMGFGYLFIHQEPPGSTQEHFMLGGTRDERVADRIAQARGMLPIEKGMCKKCFRIVSREKEDEPLQANNPPAGQDPLVCPQGGQHELAT